MALTETLHHPGKEIAHAVRVVGSGIHRHWKSLGLVFATLSIPAGYAINQFISLNSQGREITKVSDPYKPADTDSGIVIVPATATTESSPTPPPPEPTATATKVPTIEAIQPFDCGILSPEACATGEYIEWTFASDNVTVQGLGFRLKPGEKIKIKEELQVAGKENKPSSPYNYYTLIAARKDGSGQFYYFGNITPINVDSVGKDLPANTTVGEIGNSDGSTDKVFKKANPEVNYNFVVAGPVGDLQKMFKDKMGIPPKKIKIDDTGFIPTAGGGIAFFGVKPPSQ